MLAKEGETGETGEVGDGVESGMKRNAGTCVGLDCAEEMSVMHRGEWLLCCGRKKLVDGEREIGVRLETVEFERLTEAVEVFRFVAVAWVDLSASAHGVVQMLFECPQA